METEQTPTGLQAGLTIEHILLSVTVVSTKESAGQFDDSAARQAQKALMEYHGVKSVNAQVLYDHTKIEQHVEGCECGKCTLIQTPEPVDEAEIERYSLKDGKMIAAEDGEWCRVPEVDAAWRAKDANTTP